MKEIQHVSKIFKNILINCQQLFIFKQDFVNKTISEIGVFSRKK